MSEVDAFLAKFDNNSVTLKKDGQEYVLTDERLRELAAKFLELCQEDASNRRDFGMNAKVVELLVDVKKAFFPATQKSLTASVDFDKQLESWYLTQKSLLDLAKDKKQVVVEVINDR